MKPVQIITSMARIVIGILLILITFSGINLKALNILVPAFVPIGIVVIIFSLLMLFYKKDCGVFRLLRRIMYPVSVVCVVGTGWLIFVLVAISVAGVGSQPPVNATVVVIGEGLNGNQPSYNQMTSIAAAGSYLRAHPSAMCIASGGGIGVGVNTTEASVMKDVLVSQYGIASSHIILEDQSQTTYQNMQFTAKVIQKRGLSHNIALTVPVYHMLRSELLARRAGLVPYGVPAQVNLRRQWPNFLREVLAIPKSAVLDWKRL